MIKKGIPFVALLLLSSPAFAANANTGAESENNFTEVIKNETRIVNEDTANVSNEVFAIANTGFNKISENTLGNVNCETGEAAAGSQTVQLETGNAAANVSVSNEVNKNTVEVQKETEEEQDQEGEEGEQDQDQGTAAAEGQVSVTPVESGELAAAETAPETFSGTLAETGTNQWMEMALLLGLPFMVLYFLRKYELKTGKIIA